MVGALQGGEHAGLRRRTIRGFVENGVERAPLRQAAAQAAVKRVRQIERAQRPVEKARIAEANLQSAGAGGGGRLYRQSENLRVGGLRVAAAVAFEPALSPFAALAGAGPKNRTEIGILRRAPGLRRGEVSEADWDRVVRPQAELFAAGSIGQEKPAADFFARHVEENRGRLQRGRLDPVESGRDQLFESARAGLVGRQEGQSGVQSSIFRIWRIL